MRFDALALIDDFMTQGDASAQEAASRIALSNTPGVLRVDQINRIIGNSPRLAPSQRHEVSRLLQFILVWREQRRNDVRIRNEQIPHEGFSQRLAPISMPGMSPPSAPWLIVQPQLKTCTRCNPLALPCS